MKKMHSKRSRGRRGKSGGGQIPAGEVGNVNQVGKGGGKKSGGGGGHIPAGEVGNVNKRK